MRGLLLFLVLVLVRVLACQSTAPCTQRTVIVDLFADGASAQISVNDFIAKVGRNAARVTSIQRVTRPAKLVVLLDASRSMVESSSKWMLAQLAVRTVVSAAPTSITVAFASFARDLMCRVSLGQPRTEIMRCLDETNRIMPGLKGERGHTGILDAINAVMEDADAGDTILLVSDGADNASVNKLKPIEERLLQRGIRFSLILFPDSFVPSPDLHVGPWNILQLVRETGGWVQIPQRHPLSSFSNPMYDITPETISRFQAALVRMTRHVNDRFALEIEFRQPMTKSVDWDLRLQRPAASIVNLLYPARLLGCTRP